MVANADQPGPLTDALDEAVRQAEPLDELLADAALGTWRRFAIGSSVARLTFNLARHPGAVVRRSSDYLGELGRIAAGVSDVAPSPRDRRFSDTGWQHNPFLRRLLQTYLTTANSAEAIVGDAELDWESHEKIEFALDNLIEALAPSNSPLTNPAAIKTAVDSGGASLVTGARRFLRDVSSPPRIPSMVDRSQFTVGGNLAITPGKVVHRTEMFELIQYAPTTPEVLSVPLLMVPPMINKYYVMDLAPGRSLVEFLVGQGVQVFMVSWRNPQSRHRDWGFDSYGSGILEALGAVEQITGSQNTQLFGACSGGVVSAMTAAHLAQAGILDRLAGLTLVVTVLDQSRAGFAGAAVDRRTINLAKAASARKGYLDGRTLAEVFAWLRPSDLIWNYWVSSYLLGKEPPAFDILAWNADVTRMPAKLHHDFLDQGVGNTLVTPGDQMFLDSPVDLGAVDVDAYVVAGVADHLCDWKSCYGTPNLLGGKTRFVLSTSGHIAAIVNPPGNPKARFQVSDDNQATPEDYLSGAAPEQGTWWTDYVAWLHDRCGPMKPAPRELGGGRFEPLVDAPGTYVFEQ
jgi:poly[(R)-3-hydroxyalkanoate] polymerase subunit PhaC